MQTSRNHRTESSSSHLKQQSSCHLAITTSDRVPQQIILFPGFGAVRQGPIFIQVDIPQKSFTQNQERVCRLIPIQRKENLHMDAINHSNIRDNRFEGWSLPQKASLLKHSSQRLHHIFNFSSLVQCMKHPASTTTSIHRQVFQLGLERNIRSVHFLSQRNLHL